MNARERLLLTGQLYATRNQCVEAVHELLTCIFMASSPVRTVSGGTWCFTYYNEHHEKTGTPAKYFIPARLWNMPYTQ
jgi:hypothetical protein